MFNLSRQSSGFRFLHTSKSILIQRNQVLHAKRLEIGQTIKLRLSGTIRSGTIISKPKRGEWNVAITNSDGQISNQVLKKSDILSSELVSPNVNPVVASRSTSIEDSTADTISISSTVDSIYVSNPSKETTISYTIPPDAHAKCSRWIIFSDLHVKGSSMETCEEVLREVHKVALHKDAGIIFLGDFWHVRGSLSVELLNRVLRSLRMWTQPVIMIPGTLKLQFVKSKLIALYTYIQFYYY